MPVGEGVFVAGVGRSGTSVATEALVRMGLHGPVPADLMPANEWNPTGYWESSSLAALNDEMLGRLGADWWTPPAELELAPLEEYADRAVALFTAVFERRTPWVWKDPRLTVLLPFWEQVLGVQPVLVPFRDPRAVAASIARRDGLTHEQAIAVWERHTRLLLTHLAGRRALVVCYDDLLADAAGWSTRVARFVAEAGLEVGSSGSSGDLLVSSANRIEGTLDPAQQALAELVRAHAGAHQAFPSLALPEPSAQLAAELASVRAPEWMAAP